MPQLGIDYFVLKRFLFTLMRVPGLLIIDSIWLYDRTQISKSIQHNYLSRVTSIYSNTSFIVGFSLLILPIGIIKGFYKHLLGMFVAILAHFATFMLFHPWNDCYHNKKGVLLIKEDTFIGHQGTLMTANLVFAIIVSLIMSPFSKRSPLYQIIGCYLYPCIAKLCDASNDTMELLHAFSNMLAILTTLQYVYSRVPDAIRLGDNYYRQISYTADNLGTFGAIWFTLSRVFTAANFCTFWIVSFGYQVYLAYEKEDFSAETFFADGVPLGTSWNIYLLSAASNLVVSPVSIIATGFMVANFTEVALGLAGYYIYGDYSYRVQRRPIPGVLFPSLIGCGEGITTLLLSFLTGLIDLKKMTRFAVLTIILFVIFSSVLRTMLDVAEPVVSSLSTADRNKPYYYHLKIVVFLLAILLLPIYLTWRMCVSFPIDIWMGIILATCTLTSVQVLDLVVVHLLSWYDSTRDEPWEPLDYLVYIIRAIVRIFEFIIAASVVLAGIYQGVIVNLNITNCFILAIHFYANVWRRLEAGYHSFIYRRKAMRKCSKLPSPTMEQLADHDDVCPICVMKMPNEETTVMTQCKHIFHRVCLRRWLGLKEQCPMCNAIVNTGQDDGDAYTGPFQGPLRAFEQFRVELFEDESGEDNPPQEAERRQR